MSGGDESAAYSVTNESGDMFAIGCTESPDLPDTLREYCGRGPWRCRKSTTPCPWRRNSLGRISPCCPGCKNWLGCGTDVFQAPRVMVVKAGSWSNHCENLCNRQNGLDADTVLTQRRRLRDTKTDCKQQIRKHSCCEEIILPMLYSVDKAPKCGELEAAGLMCGDPLEGRAEFALWQSVAIFHGCEQQCEGDDVATMSWSPEAFGSPCPKMMAVSAATSSPSPAPSIAAQNIRFLSLSDILEQRAQHQQKLANVQHLAKQFVMTANLETHVTGAKAELFFCRYGHAVSLFMAWRSLCKKPGLIISIPLSQQ